jgi:hypothetical protein
VQKLLLGSHRSISSLDKGMLRRYTIKTLEDGCLPILCSSTPKIKLNVQLVRGKQFLRALIIWILPFAHALAPRSMVVDHLNAESKTKNIGVGCIYLNHNEAKDQTPVNLLAGL